MRAGSIVVLKCKADNQTTIRWYLNSTLPLDNDANRGVYVISYVDESEATSHLQLSDVSRRHNGRYSCRSLQDASDNDTIVLTVRDNRQGDLFTMSSVNNA